MAKYEHAERSRILIKESYNLLEALSVQKYEHENHSDAIRYLTRRMYDFMDDYQQEVNDGK